MTKLTRNQRYHLILADIAMAAAVAAMAGETIAPEGDYAPGRLRDAWLARSHDPRLRSRVLALASAGLAALQEAPAGELAAASASAGVPLSDKEAVAIAGHFEDRREAVLTYRH